VPDRTSARAPDGASAVYEAVDGQRSVGDMGRVTGLGEFEVTKQLFHLGQSGHVFMQTPRLRGGSARRRC
jgi:hypothetical protein